MMKKVFAAAAALLVVGTLSASEVAKEATQVLLTPEQCKGELANCKDEACTKKLEEQGCKQAQ